MNNSPILVGLASFGMSGRIFHAPFIKRNPHFRLQSILERTKNNSKENYPEATIVRSFDALLSDSEIELIIINTPSYLHYEMTKAALLAGKHVVVEKPFTATSKEGEELIKLAQKRNLILTVYHNKRLEGGFKTVQSLLSEQKLGKTNHARLAIHRYKPTIGPKAWKENDLPGAGILYDIGSHLIDQCLILFGTPQRIEADLQIQRPHGKVIDYFLITFYYGSFEVEIISDMFSKDSRPNFSISGENAAYIKYGNDPQEEQLAAKKINWDTLGKDTPENFGIFISHEGETEECIPTEDGNYMTFYENLFGAIRQNKSLFVSPNSALEVIKTIEEILKFPVVKNTILID